MLRWYFVIFNQKNKTGVPYVNIEKWALVALFIVLAAFGVYAIWVYVLPLLWETIIIKLKWLPVLLVAGFVYLCLFDKDRQNKHNVAATEETEQSPANDKQGSK